MGKRGPQKKPLELVKLTDYGDHHPINEDAPRPPKVFTLPSPPKWLDTYAKAEWKRMGEVLIRVGVLTETDLPAFAAYCSAYARWRRCEEHMVKVHKEVGAYTDRYKRGRHVEMVTLERSFEQMIRLAQSFGMTPSARTSIKVDRPIDDKDFFG